MMVIKLNRTIFWYTVYQIIHTIHQNMFAAIQLYGSEESDDEPSESGSEPSLYDWNPLIAMVKIMILLVIIAMLVGGICGLLLMWSAKIIASAFRECNCRTMGADFLCIFCSL